jgi:DNA repair exonuclease SbcCD ATPase subunit
VDVVALQKAHDAAQKSRAAAAEDRSGVRTRLRQVLDDLKFFAENALCPSCGQDIPEDTAHAHLESLEVKRAGLETDLEDFDAAIQLADDDLPKLRAAWQEAVRSNAAAQRERALLRSQIAEKQKAIERLVAEKTRLAEEANPYAEQRRTVAERRRHLRGELEEKTARETELLGEMASAEYWRGGFRKVRLFCLERVLGELEVEARNEFMELGLVGWGIGFKTATETKSGTVRLGVQAEIRSPDYQTPFDAMSPGEQQRARLGASLGLGSLIQRWSGTRWDVEVYDEPTNWLSEQGVEDLLETLTDRSARQGKSIWVCDHRALASGGFVEVVQVVKDENGSRVER